MAGSIKIRVGASMDRSVNVVFGAVEKRAEKAGQNVWKALNKGFGAGAAGGKQFKGVAEEAERTFMRVAASSRKANALMKRDQDKSTRDLANGFKQIAKVAERENMNAWRAERRARDAFAARTSYRAARVFTGAGRHAARVGGDILRGAGVDFSVAGSVSRAVGLESTATRISNAGYFRGAAGPAGVRQDPNKISGEARDIGTKLGFNPQDVLEGLDKFVAKTGNLKEGRDIIGDMAKLAGATGSDLADVVDAAGDVSQALGDVPDKAKKIDAVMRNIAGQGKLGAVEMKNMATQMAKVGAAAGQFEGDAGKNIIELGALVQLARQKGGAASATQSATAVAGMTNILKTPKRVKEFKAQGIDVFGASGAIRDPIELIKESIGKTKGDPMKLKSMWANVVGAKPVDALATTYRQAGGGAAGMAAVDAAVNQLLKATISEAEIEESNKKRMQTTAAKAQIFQNNLDKIAASMADNLLPQFEKLAPTVLAAAEGLAKLVGWAARNPGAAIAATAIASVMRALTESAVRTHIDRAVGGAGGIGGANASGYSGRGTSAATGGTFSGAVGAAGLGLVVGSAVATGIYTQGTGDFDATSKNLGEASSTLAGTYGHDLGLGLIQAKEKLKKEKESAGGIWGSFKTAAGIGSDAEIKGMEDIVGRKEKEYAKYQKTGELPPGAAEAMAAKQGKMEATIDPTVLSRGVADGLTSRIINARITNPKDIGATPTPTGGDLNGRDAPAP